VSRARLPLQGLASLGWVCVSANYPIADALFALHSDAYMLRYWDAPPWRDRVRADRYIGACRPQTGIRRQVQAACPASDVPQRGQWVPAQKSRSWPQPQMGNVRHSAIAPSWVRDQACFSVFTALTASLSSSAFAGAYQCHPPTSEEP